MTTIARVLDTTGLSCPVPILRTKKEISSLAPGEVLKLIATDPGSVKDVDAFCRQTGNELLESQQDGNVFVFLLRKG